MRWYANNALTSVAVLFLGGLAFALAVHHFLREQTAVRLRQIEQARAAAEAVRHSEQQARVQALRARVTAAERAARVAALPGDPTQGKAIYASCAYCHGRRGEGKEEFFAPQLAGIAPSYVKQQLVKFREGVRGVHPYDIYGREMAQAMLLLRDAAAVDHVVAHIASLDVERTVARHRGDAVAGAQHYASCVPCHGSAARGSARRKAPGLAALPAWYLEKQLTDFKSGVRGGHERDLEGQQMIAAMQSVDESVFADLIAYIQSRQ